MNDGSKGTPRITVGVDLGDRHFVGYVQVPSVDDFFRKAAHKGFVILFDRHRSFLLAYSCSCATGRHQVRIMPPGGVRRIDRRLASSK